MHFKRPALRHVVAMKHLACLDALAKEFGSKSKEKRFLASWVSVDEEALANKLRPMAERKNDASS